MPEYSGNQLRIHADTSHSCWLALGGQKKLTNGKRDWRFYLIRLSIGPPQRKGFGSEWRSILECREPLGDHRISQ